MEKPGLLVHEWLSIAAIIGLLAILTALSCFSIPTSLPPDTAHPHYISEPTIEVCVEGAVAHPGKIRVEKGSTLRQVLEQAILLPEADVKRLNLESKVRRNKVIKIPQISFITVNLQGAVETQTLRLPKGSQTTDLLDKLHFKEGADLRKLQRKRRLKDGETIIIPLSKGSTRPHAQTH